MRRYKKNALIIIVTIILSFVLTGSAVFSFQDNGSGVKDGGSASGVLDDTNRPKTRLSIYVPEDFEAWLRNSVAYFSQQNNKAVYLAQDGYGGWAGGYSYAAGTLAEAKSAALGFCNQDRQTMGISSPCVLYAENDRIAYYDFSIEKATIADNFDIYLPSMAWDGGEYSANLEFAGYDQYGNMYWKLISLNTGYAYANNAVMSSATLMISIDSIIYAGTYDLWLVLEYAYSSNGYYYWKYNNLGFN